MGGGITMRTVTGGTGRWMRGPGPGSRPAGFTFVEVLVATIVLALLAALMIPAFLQVRDRADAATAQSLLRTGASAVEAAAVAPDGYAGLTTADLGAVEGTIRWLGAPGADAARGEVSVTATGPAGYTLSTTDSSGVLHTLTKDLTAAPTVTRTCGAGCSW